METIDNRTRKEKWEDFKGRVGMKWGDFKKFCSENKAIVVISGLTIAGLVSEGMKTNRQRLKQEEEKEKQYNTIYDRSHGHYIKTARPLTPRQQEAIDKRHDQGEDYYDILHDLGIKLKR